MKNQNNFLGLLLFLIGGLLLMYNFNFFEINIREIVKFWPLLLVYSGLVLLVGNKKGWVLPMAMLAITVIFILVYFAFQKGDSNLI